MNEVVNSGVINIFGCIGGGSSYRAHLVVFINRASSRTNEQIELLEALLDHKNVQNALLRRLCEANEPEKADNRPLRVKNR